MSEDKAIVRAVTAGLRTLVDDTVRLTVDFEPRDANKAMTLFGRRGVDIAVACLNDVDIGFPEGCGKTPSSSTVGVPSGDPYPPRADYGRYAKALRLSGFFRSPAVWVAIGTDQEYREWLQSQPCAFRGAKPPGIECSGDIVAAHVRRVANGAGVGCKPLYSALPMCDAHHRLQHEKGESVYGGKDVFDRLRIVYLQSWGWETLKRTLGFSHWNEVPPQTLGDWAREHEVYHCLPVAYREVA